MGHGVPALQIQQELRNLDIASPGEASRATILVYNFVQPDDPADRQGGGVAVYQRNLVAALDKAGHRVICLSAGDRYDVFRREPRVQFGHGGFEIAVIVNSPVFAPSHSNFYNIAAYAEVRGLDFVPALLRQRYSAIDVFHFQNVEGLTAGFFRSLRTEFPHSRILVSAHNYGLVCPQRNLWFREHRVCGDYRGGRACVNCLTSPDRSSYEGNIRRMRKILEGLGVRRQGLAMATLRSVLRAPFMLRRRLRRAPPTAAWRRDLINPERAAQYARYRHENIALALPILRDLGVTTVIIVTDATHAPRACLIARGLGLRATTSSPPLWGGLCTPSR